MKLTKKINKTKLATKGQILLIQGIVIIILLPGSIINAPTWIDSFNPGYCNNFCDIYEE